MPAKLTTHQPFMPLQTDARRLVRFSLASALMHGAALAALLAWPGGKASLPPPARAITVELRNVALSRQELPPAPPLQQLNKVPVPPLSAAPAKAVPLQVPATARPAPTAPVAAPPTTVSLSSLSSAPSPAQSALPTGATRGGPSTASAPVAPFNTVSVQAAAPKPAAAAPSGTRDYLSQCRSLIENNKEYPVMARRGRIEGSVTVRCVLTRDGSLRESGVARTSGSALLDNAALKAVRCVGRFPPLPPEVHEGALAFDVPITFMLTTD